MYVSLLKLFANVAENPLIYIGLVLLLMASWGMIVGVITEITIALFDRRPGPSGARMPRDRR